MSGFERAWLEAREPLDHAVRSTVLAERFMARLGRRPRLLDLGSGTGSNIRYLAPRLRRAQRWIALDHDPALLGAMAWVFERFADEAGLRFARRTGELVLDGAEGEIVVAPRPADLSELDQVLGPDAIDAVTASALLDLTSAAWLDDLADRLAAEPRPALFALSFDGRMSFAPERAEDAEIRARFVRHQRTAKSFGPALGPDAVRHFAAGLEARGRSVEQASSDWRLGPSCAGLTAGFLEGLAQVLDRTGGSAHRAWLNARHADLAAGRLRIAIGHQDLLAL